MTQIRHPLLLWQNKAQSCINAIKEKEYYLPLWNQVCSPTPPHQHTSKQALLKQFQDFWELLPDSPAIRVNPFWQVCDLAEEYCFGEHDA